MYNISTCILVKNHLISKRTYNLSPYLCKCVLVYAPNPSFVYALDITRCDTYRSLQKADYLWKSNHLSKQRNINHNNLNLAAKILFTYQSQVKSSSMQLWFYVQTRHSLRHPLAEITLRVHADSFTIAARTVRKDF